MGAATRASHESMWEPRPRTAVLPDHGSQDRGPSRVRPGRSFGGADEAEMLSYLRWHMPHQHRSLAFLCKQCRLASRLQSGGVPLEGDRRTIAAKICPVGFA